MTDINQSARLRQIADHLNKTVKCAIAPSPVEGVGVFAVQDIKKGDVLDCQQTARQVFQMSDLSYLNDEVKELILRRWPGADEEQEFFHPHSDAYLILYMNHSDDPNYDPVTDTALKDIKKGEELFETYPEKP